MQSCSTHSHSYSADHIHNSGTHIHTRQISSDFGKICPSNWLNDNILSTVKQGPIKITRQCTTDMVHAYKKAQEARHQKETVNIVEEELSLLKDSQKKNAARMKELRVAKSNIAKKGCGKALKAESSSSGKVAVAGVSREKRAQMALKVATMRKGTS